MTLFKVAKICRGIRRITPFFTFPGIPTPNTNSVFYIKPYCLLIPYKIQVSIIID